MLIKVRKERKRGFWIALAAFLGVLFVTPSLSAQSDSLTLSAKIFKKQGYLQLKVEPNASRSNCEVNVYGAEERRLLRGRAKRAVKLGTVELLDTEQAVVATKLPKIAKSVPVADRLVYFRAIARCSNFSESSKVKRLRPAVTKKKRGVSSLKTWLRKVKRKVLTDSYVVKRIFANLSFSRPVDLQSPGSHSDNLYVVTQEGVIYSFPNQEDASTATTFLDLTDEVEFNEGEQGLLGLAFHPNVAENRQFYVYYTEKDTDSSVLARYQISESNELVADTTEHRVLVVPQPGVNHNGGGLRFGPDGYLYLGLGDGGGAGDPFENGQDRTSMLGSVIRINVDSTEGSKQYAIPDANPYKGNGEGFAEEIFAYGFRNPWRMNFDSEDGTLWLGDVGQGSFEEVDIVEMGKNYGWNTMEGKSCYPSSSDCDQTGLELPVDDYSHALGRSITGGVVYRGEDLRDLRGMYIFGDFISGRIWSLKQIGNRVVRTQLVASELLLASISTDVDNKLYLLSFDGGIYTLEQS